MSAPDFTDVVHVEKRLRDATNALQEMTGDVASALTVKEFVSERRKNLLASYMSPLVAKGMGVAAAEAEARATAGYVGQVNLQAEQYEAAEKVLAKRDAMRAMFDASRSILSLSKESLRQLSA